MTRRRMTRVSGTTGRQPALAEYLLRSLTAQAAQFSREAAMKADFLPQTLLGLKVATDAIDQSLRA